MDAHHTTENELLAQARQFYAEYNRMEPGTPASGFGRRYNGGFTPH